MSSFVQFLVRLDRAWFHSINSIAGKNGFLDWLARVGADDHIIPVLLALLVLATLFFAKGQRARERAFRSMICAVGAAFLSMVLLYALNSLFFRPRPFTTQAVHLLFYHNTDSAFPSNAATLAFALAFGVFLYWRGLGGVMLGLAAFQGLSRTFTGIHYPFDIIAGLVLGLGAALVLRAFDPLYAPFARCLNAALDRLLASWKSPPALEPVSAAREAGGRSRMRGSGGN